MCSNFKLHKNRKRERGRRKDRTKKENNKPERFIVDFFDARILLNSRKLIERMMPLRCTKNREISLHLHPPNPNSDRVSPHLIPVMTHYALRPEQWKANYQPGSPLLTCDLSFDEATKQKAGKWSAMPLCCMYLNCAIIRPLDYWRPIRPEL